MLGAFDNYNLGYVDREFAIAPEFEKRVNPGGGIVRPSIVVDGACVATWSSKRCGKRLAVTIEPFEPLAPEIEEAIAAEVADIGRFEGASTPLRSRADERHQNTRLQPIRPSARRPAPTPTAATSRSSRRAPSTSTGPRRP